jgi:hypothetical protein
MKINIKKANIKDSFSLFQLRNEEKARKNSINTKPIKLRDHNSWIKKKLSNEKNVFLTIKKKSEIIGSIRYEIKNIFTHVSINIKKQFRNLGYGSTLLKKSEKFLKKNLLIISTIKKGNKKSIKIFKKNKYMLLSKKKNYILIKLFKYNI